jgi:tagaturonate reductase
VEKYVEQWQLGDAFKAWLDEENLFCSSLVDRIVTGYPRNEAAKLNEENGYEDNLIDTGEVFGAWVIEGPEWLAKELPFVDGELPVIVTPDHKPYKQRKVRILNGAHTTMVLGAYLAGQDIVRNCMQDDVIKGYMNKAIYEEIIPTLDLPLQELKDFAAAVEERFANPFVKHQLLSIALNSVSKFKARVLPTILEYYETNGDLPKCMTFSLAALIAFYRTEEANDGEDIMAFMKTASAEEILKQEGYWGRDLSFMLPEVEKYMTLMQEKGMEQAFRQLL